MLKARTTEELIISRIKNGIRLLNKATKSPQELELSSAFTRLKSLNVGMYDDLIKEYEIATITYKQIKKRREAHR